MEAPESAVILRFAGSPGFKPFRCPLMDFSLPVG